MRFKKLTVFQINIKPLTTKNDTLSFCCICYSFNVKWICAEILYNAPKITLNSFRMAKKLGRHIYDNTKEVVKITYRLINGV